MPAPSRQLSVVALLVVSAGMAGYSAGAHFGPRPGPGEHSAQPRELDERGQWEAELERRRQVFQRRTAAKDQAIRELLAGRLTLCQAAARFRDAEREAPLTWGPPPQTGDGPGEGERLCRDVMDWADSWVAENVPAAADSLTARLKEELEQHRGTDGVVRLPD